MIPQFLNDIWSRLERYRDDIMSLNWSDIERHFNDIISLLRYDLERSLTDLMSLHWSSPDAVTLYWAAPTGLLVGLNAVWALVLLRWRLEKGEARVYSTPKPSLAPLKRLSAQSLRPWRAAFGGLRAMSAAGAAAVRTGLAGDPPKTRAEITREARELAPRAPTHPRGAMGRMAVVGDLRRLWKARLRPAAKTPGPWMRKLENLAMSLAGGGYSRSFVPIEVYERFNFIRPGVPTNIWAVWLAKAALDPEVLRDYQDWPRRVLPEDTRIADLDGPGALWDLPRDDQHRLIDVVNVERRASDRHLQSNGYAAGEVDQPPDDKVWWHQYLTWIGAVLFVVGSVLIAMFTNN